MSTMQYNREQEIELIKQYQQTKDPMVLQKLRRIFAGTISSATMKSPTYGLDQRTLNQKASIAFSRALINYDPTKGAPTTAITNSIKGYFMNSNNKYKNTTRLSQDDTILQTQIHKATSNLELKGENSDNISEDMLLNEVSRIRDSKVKVNNAWIGKIQLSTRKELSGDRTLGEDGVGENLSLMNVLNSQGESADEIHERQMITNRFENALSQLSEQEQGLIKDKNPGLINEEDKNKKLSWNQIAINNNYKSRYLAEKAYEDSMKKLQGFMMDE